MRTADGPRRALILGTRAAAQATESVAAALDELLAETVVFDGDEGPEAVCERIRDHADVDLACLVFLPQAGLAAKGVAETELDEWRSCVDILSFTGSALQALQRTCSGELTIVVIGMQIALTGSAQRVALSSVMEGQRSLAKVAAREWGARGCRVHWIGVDPAALAPDLADIDIPRKADLIPVALGAAPTLPQVARLLPLLASRDAAALTGASLLCDGGGWMAP